MAHRALASGTLLANRYRIERLIKAGGFAAVYIATDLRQKNRRCAVKETFDLSAESAEQFRLEAEILAGISHENLPAVLDYFPHNGGLYLVMEFIEGEDLESHLELSGIIPEDAVRNWAEQLCDALTVLHRHRPPIIHRDIKPANVKITPEGRAVLVDFGIAKLYHAGNNTLIAARAVTDGFSPLEQYGQGSTDARSDIYALGATMYNLITGVIPPDAPNRVALDELVSPSQFIANLSPPMEQAILRALSLRPADRFQSAEDMRWALAATYTPPLSLTGALSKTGNLRDSTGRIGYWWCPICQKRNMLGAGYCAQCHAPAPTMEIDLPTHIIPPGGSPSGPLPLPPPASAPAQTQAQAQAVQAMPTQAMPAHSHGWEVMSGPANGTLLALAGRPGQGLVACGERGLVMMYHNGAWVTLPAATSYTLHAVAIISGHVWAVGDFGSVLHFTGGRWSVLPNTVEDPLHAIALDAPMSGWIASSAGALIDLRDLSLEPMPVRRGRINAIAIDDLGDGWAVGNESLLLRLAQGTWKTRIAASWGTLWCVDHAGPDDAWVVGAKGVLLHLDATGWQMAPELHLPDLRGLAFNRRGEGWAVGDQGTLVWFNGQEWSVPADRPTTAALRSVAWYSDDEAWVVGEQGVVLRWRR